MFHSVEDHGYLVQSFQKVAPGRIVREATERDLQMLEHAAAAYRSRIAAYATQLRPDPRFSSPE